MSEKLPHCGTKEPFHCPTLWRSSISENVPQCDTKESGISQENVSYMSQNVPHQDKL